MILLFRKIFIIFIACIFIFVIYIVKGRTEMNKGMDLRKENATQAIEFNSLAEMIIYIEEKDNGIFLLSNKRFEDSLTLMKYLNQQESGFFQYGILLISLDKVQQENNDILEILSTFCIERNIDLFVKLPTGKPGLDKAAFWIIKSTKTRYRGIGTKADHTF